MRLADRAEIKIALSFLFVSILWIVFSDALFLIMHKNISVEFLTFLQTGKGLVYICFVTILIYMLVRRSNTRLFKSREQYKMFFEDNPNPMIIFDVQTLAILKVNNAAVHKYEYSHDEFYAMTLRDLRSDEDAQKLANLVPTLPKNNFNATNWKHIKKNGEIVDVQITSCATSFNGNDNCRLVLVHDVSDVLNTQNKIDKKEKLYASLVDSQSNFLVRIDPLGNFSFTNQSFVKAFVSDPEEEIPFLFIEIVEQQDENKFRRALAECYKSPDEIIDVSLRCKNINNTAFKTVHWELKAITDKMNQVTEIQCVGFDISERKHLEQTIYTLNNLLNHISEGFIIFNLQGIILNANEKMGELAGISSQKLINSNIDTLVDDSTVNIINTLPILPSGVCPGIPVNITLNNRLLQFTFCRINEFISVVVKDLTIEKNLYDDIHTLSKELNKALEQHDLSVESSNTLKDIQQKLSKKNAVLTNELQMNTIKTDSPRQAQQ